MRLDELGEFGFLARVQAALPRSAPGVVLGSGDDAAVLLCGDGYLLVSTDAMVEGRHFRREWLSPAEIGERAARAALSDLAAMGGTPRGLFASVAFPPDIPAADAEALAAGLETGAVACGTHLLGGDLVASPGPLFLDVTVIGETAAYWASLRGRRWRSPARLRRPRPQRPPPSRCSAPAPLSAISRPPCASASCAPGRPSTSSPPSSPSAPSPPLSTSRTVCSPMWRTSRSPATRNCAWTPRRSP